MYVSRPRHLANLTSGISVIMGVLSVGIGVNNSEGRCAGT